MVCLGSFFGDPVRCISALGDSRGFASGRRLELRRETGRTAGPLGGVGCICLGEGALNIYCGTCTWLCPQPAYMQMRSARGLTLWTSGGGRTRHFCCATFEVQQSCQSLGSISTQLLVGGGPQLSGPPYPRSPSREYLLSSNLGSVL